MMSLEIRKVDDAYGIFNRYNAEFLRWQDLLLDKDEVKAYLKKDPFPQDREYNQDEFINDLKAEGSIIIYSERIETAEYISGLISDLI